MNRSILIVICDFLLVSLLVFSSVDINDVAKNGHAHAQLQTSQVATNQVDSTQDSAKDLTSVMRMALDEERRSREQLMAELNRARQTSARQETTLSEREKQLQAFQQQLQTREQQMQNLQNAQANLEQQYASAQTNLQNLSQRLQSTSTEALLSKEKLSALQSELANLQSSNQSVLAERQRLANQLQVAQVEQKHAAEQVASMQEQVKVERQEKERLSQQATKLAEGVKALATKSSELAQEVRESRPMVPNAIFSDFATNRVGARFSASRSGLLGGATRTRDTDTVLASDGTNVFALCHVQDTPLTLFNPGTDWESLSGTLSHGSAMVPARSLCFCVRDPRLVYVPLTDAEVRQLGTKVYKISSDPYKYQDAVLIGTREGYYGECRFQIDLSAPDYLKLDNNFLKGLFGKFNPSRGDLVFSKTGELIGVMANGTYCLMLKDFTPAACFQFGADVRAQHTGLILSQLYSIVTGLGQKLQ